MTSLWCHICKRL